MYCRPDYLSTRWGPLVINQSTNNLIIIRVASLIALFLPQMLLSSFISELCSYLVCCEVNLKDSHERSFFIAWFITALHGL